MHEPESSSLIEQILAVWPSPRWDTTRILLAVSGGADSIALLHAFAQLQENRELLAVGHFDHGWRGQESCEDAQFVQRTCAQLQIPCFVGQANLEETPSTDVQSKTEQSEQQARELRYQFLTETAYRIGARYVVTAHTADDRVETLLHNLFRGTGLSGICSLRTFRDLDQELVLVRPMLNTSKSTVLSFLDAQKQAFREDSSNQNTRYRRNFLRNEVLPLVQATYGETVTQQLLSFSDTVGETMNLLDDLAAEYWSQVQRVGNPHLVQRFAEISSGVPMCCFPSKQILPVHWPILHRALANRWRELAWGVGKLSRDHWLKLRDLHEQESDATNPKQRQTGKSLLQLPGKIHVALCEGWVLLYR